MAHGCPQCGESHQVVHQPAFWRSLPLCGAGPGMALLIGVLCLMSGAMVPGVLLLAAATVSGLWVGRQASEAHAARADWEKQMYCRTPTGRSCWRP